MINITVKLQVQSNKKWELHSKKKGSKRKFSQQCHQRKIICSPNNLSVMFFLVLGTF